MGERLLCKQEVIGSIPFTSTKLGFRVWAPVWAAGLAAFAGTVLEIPDVSGLVFVMVKRFLVSGDPGRASVWGLREREFGLIPLGSGSRYAESVRQAMSGTPSARHGLRKAQAF